MKDSKFRLISLLAALVFAPLLVLADHSTEHTITELQQKIKELQNSLNSLKSQPQVGLVQDVAIKSFNKDLFLGMQNDSEVKKLQEFLTESGYYSGPVTGNFGPLTFAAVKKFQGARGLPQTGYFGPLSRKAANDGFLASKVGASYRVEKQPSLAEAMQGAKEEKRSPFSPQATQAPSLPPVIVGKVVRKDDTSLIVLAQSYDSVANKSSLQEFRVPQESGDTVEVQNVKAGTSVAGSWSGIAVGDTVSVTTSDRRKIIKVYR